MLKRTIFLLSYISFFILVPACVYFFWPVQENSISQQVILQSDSETFQDSYGEIETDSLAKPDSLLYADSLAQAGINGSQPLFNSLKNFDKIAESCYRFLNADVAIIICFPLSVLFAFLLSLHKFLRPTKKTGGIITGIFIFNLLYIPVYYSLMIMKLWMAAFYYLWFFVAMLTKPLSLVVLIALLILFITSIVLLILGIRKGKKLSEISPE